MSIYVLIANVIATLAAAGVVYVVWLGNRKRHAADTVGRSTSSICPRNSWVSRN